MRIGAKYKIARRLGVPIFEKTQKQKFALSKIRKETAKLRRSKHMRKQTDYGLAMLEKQKARYTYIIGERQFSNYVKAAIAKRGVNNAQALFENLEMRLDNVSYRIGFANTRLFSRQMVNHGHITVNGKRVDIPSAQVYEGDIISIRPGSTKKKMFENLDERLKEIRQPAWIKFDSIKKEGKIEGRPKLGEGDLLFDINTVLEFYTR